MDLENPADNMWDGGFWKLVIVDDDNFTHFLIRDLLKGFEFEGKPLKIYSAYTGTDALKILSKYKDIALVLLDMYIGDEITGLKLTRYIREVAENSMVRIVLMTSQGSSALQKDAILNYDINGYEEKKDLLTKKLHTVVASSLRYYKDIVQINNNKIAMEEIATTSSRLFEAKTIKEFLSNAFYHLKSIIGLYEGYNGQINGLAAAKHFDEEDFYIVEAYGRYKKFINRKMKDVLPKDEYNLILNVHYIKDHAIIGDRYISTYKSSSNAEAIILFDVNEDKIKGVDFEVLDIFHKNTTASFESLCINVEIEETQREILYLLGELTEARSEETGNHVKRVSKYAKILAEKYGLTDRDVMLVTMASPIHDIGKIAISDQILLKQGKLTPSEFEIVKTHTTIGYNLLKGSNRDVLKSAAIIAHEHHERYDGKGYPRGLKGEEIHIFGRIVAVADVFDALGSPRVYKKAWILKDVLAYFKEERGKHFDPKLVDILFDNLDEFLRIKEEYSDERANSHGILSK